MRPVLLALVLVGLPGCEALLLGGWILASPVIAVAEEIRNPQTLEPDVVKRRKAAITASRLRLQGTECWSQGHSTGETTWHLSGCGTELDCRLLDDGWECEKSTALIEETNDDAGVPLAAQ